MVSEACAQPRASSVMAVSRVSSPPPTSNENSQPTAENWCFTQVSSRRGAARPGSAAGSRLGVGLGWAGEGSDSKFVGLV